MSEFRPILADDPPDRVKALLSSARIDVPPVQGQTRALAALGLGATLATSAQVSSAAIAATAGAAKAAGSATGIALLVSKWVAMGVVAGAVASGTVVTARNRAALVSCATPEKVSEPPAREERRAPSHARFGDVAQEPPAVAPQHEVRAAPVATTPPARSLPREAPAVGATPEAVQPSPDLGQRPTLMAEIGSLDRAQRALAAGQPAAALAALDAHQQQFASPRLGPEAAVLRIQALMALGRTLEARNLGADLLRRDPDGALAQRVRSLLGMPARP
jgi:hypothetical protein